MGSASPDRKNRQEDCQVGSAQVHICSTGFQIVGTRCSVHGNGNVGNSLFRPEHIDRLIAVAASQLDPVRNENLSWGKGGRSY